jgi:hypothetical protein
MIVIIMPRLNITELAMEEAFTRQKVYDWMHHPHVKARLAEVVFMGILPRFSPIADRGQSFRRGRWCLWRRTLQLGYSDNSAGTGGGSLKQVFNCTVSKIQHPQAVVPVVGNV